MRVFPLTSINSLSLRAALLASAALVASPALAQSQAPAVDSAVAAPASEAPRASGTEVAEVVVTGVRGSERRTVANSPTPIDVVSAKDIAATGKSDLKEILNILIPSFSLPGVNGGGTSWSVRAFTVRGLTGDEALILVNGKRRHNTSLINNLARVGNGGVPVDLDLIPVAAIDHIEVLRDGASAQYGSDAIGGVINIILKKGASGGTSETTYGQNYEGDGKTGHEALDYGFALPNDGFAHVALDIKANTPASRSLPETAVLTVPDRNYYGHSYGPGEEQIYSGAYNAELPLKNGLDLYSFSTFTYRVTKKNTGSFLPQTAGLFSTTSDSLPQVYPNGFNAYRRIYETDFQTTGGARGAALGWDWDASSTFGEDFARLYGENTINASLGPTSPTGFHLANQIFDQWTNNLDLTRDFQVGLPKPLTVSVGFEHRYERYAITAGDPASYTIGNYVIPTGPFAGLKPLPGLASYNGTSPAEAGAATRNNFAAYFDVDTKVLQNLFLGAAARYEHYTDSAGDTLSGKITTRYEFTPGYAFRATVSNGFKAPSLAQEIYASNTIAGSVQNVGGTPTLVTYPLKVFPVDSPVARALGSSPLTPERSTNYSAGFTAEPTHNVRLTVDAYEIDIANRILETGALLLTPAKLGSSPVLSTLLTQFPTGLAAQYYTNAASTRTRGVDLVAEYHQNLHGYGAVRWSAAYTYTQTDITHLKPTPAALQGLGYTVFDWERQADVTVATPRDKFIVSADWTWGKLEVNAVETLYGGYTEANTVGTPTIVGANARDYGAKWITDLEVDYQVRPSTKIGFGANNLFNTYPDTHGIVYAQGGSGLYGNFSPFGITGGYYYARLVQKF